ncbi:enoyl-CoA hydratase/isomerase family protein [Flavobacterium sp. NST-5]|uniref:Enoyl-CoA hydratase/isomerase family protein n=1 Tax=Flavobacterium ichthyis TaxID=2698827 RepID=A0ABW9Z5F3_9FLAO|nr:enoyl-CoA hydratase/isomerase family protein [Flavobacterium ichthyis]NBL63884.1 enoyl-CoA hydratase/isomerase family protein [Flavobacterium ichthyis]
MMETPQNGTIHTQVTNNIATITFSHPAGNSFPSALLAKLTLAFEDLGKNPEVNLILLKSEGKSAFCAGASFDELLAVSNLVEATNFFSGFANVINAMRKCPKLIVGRIHGKTVGGGVGLACACDFTFATNNAAVKLSEIAIGIGPFVIEPAVSKKIGQTAMSQLALDPTEWKSASWAFENHLYNKIFETIEEMDENLHQYLNQMAGFNPEALSENKKILWQNTEHWDQLLYERAAISGKLILSDFSRNALNQFKKN